MSWSRRWRSSYFLPWLVLARCGEAPGGLLAGPGSDVRGDGDAGLEGRGGGGLLAGGGQRQLAGPQAQRGVRAEAVVGRAGPDLDRGFLERQRQEPGGGELLAAGLAGVVPLAGRHVLGDAAQPG